MLITLVAMAKPCSVPTPCQVLGFVVTLTDLMRKMLHLSSTRVRNSSAVKQLG